jgi:hypothetical protein
VHRLDSRTAGWAFTGCANRLSTESTKVLAYMASRWEPTTGGYSFRFFSPEQVDEILRDGARRGRDGSHAAIERILKHEPGLQRSQLWQRIRRLKDPKRQSHHVRSIWSPEDERLLRDGYQAGWREKRGAVRQLLKRHADWRPHVIWQHAAKLGLSQIISSRGQQRAHLPWSEHDDRTLLDLAGYKSARAIAKMLHRSEAAVRYRLTTLGKSSRVHLEGFARSALASELHLSMRAIQRLIVEGLLEVRDPRITRESLDRLHESGRLEQIRQTEGQPVVHLTQESDLETIPVAADISNSPNLAGSSATVGRPSRAKRVWAEVAESLGMNVKMVEKLILRGVLKFYDPTITEKSLRYFCRRYGSFVEHDFLNRETRAWLHSSMEWIRTSGASASHRFAALRKHARIVHRCEKCGGTIRGNAFFRHLKRCTVSQVEI